MSKHFALLLGVAAVLAGSMPVLAQSVSTQEHVIEICQRVVEAERSRNDARERRYVRAALMPGFPS